MTQLFDVIVIGAGPGGYVAAIRGQQLGLKTLCIDKHASLGGTCLNVGCIPSKALLHSSEKFEEITHLKTHGIEVQGVSLDLKTLLDRKDRIVSDLTKGVQFLFKKNGVTFVQGMATLISSTQVQVNDQVYEGKAIIIATGSEAIPLDGVKIDEKHIVSSTGALSLAQVPKHMVVIGGGYIGLELGSVWRRLGAKVTVIEYAPHIVPAIDSEVGQALFKALKNQKMDFMTSTKVLSIERKSKDSDLPLDVLYEPAQGGDSQRIACDVVLSCAGRRPLTTGLNLEALGISLDARGRIAVNGSYQTTVPSIYAIGDVIQGPMLAHKAEDEGVAVMEILAGQKPHINYRAIPSVIYTMPEVASVGLTEEELIKEGIAYRIGKFPFMANSRARATGEIDGFVKVLADQTTDEVYGVHIIHNHAGTMIAEAVLALEYRASSEDIARTCHAHPTVNEALKEAALGALGRSLHI